MIGFHALNARDASYLHWIFSASDGDPAKFRDALQADGQFMRDQLLTRKVKYGELKSALVPSSDGKQIAFIYDWLEHPAFNYAVAFMELILPHLRDTLRTSVLSGDLLDFVEVDAPVVELERSLVRPSAGSTERTEWRTQYCVYFSNLRPQDVDVLHEALSVDPRYGGYLDVTFGGAVRDYLAATLAPKWIIFERKVILTHGADEPWVSDEDPVGFDLPQKGYEVVSVIDSMQAGYLSYKIESLRARQSDEDRILTLAAVTGELVDVDGVEVYVDPRKVDQYLLRDDAKLRLMTSIGLQDVKADELASIVRDKLLRNYIYDLRLAQDGTPTFAVSAEFEKPNGDMARRLLALKYDPLEKRIALVSMY